jgi:predicted metal-binding protein
MKDVFEKALSGQVQETAVIPTSALSFAPELLKACEANTCGNYNKSWSCPPAVGTLEAQKIHIRSYKYAFIFTTKHDLEDSFDYEGMMKAKEFHNRLTTELHEQFGKIHPVFGAGSCGVCEKCAYPEPCRFPDKRYSSIEAAGINVTELSRTAEVKYNNGPNTVTYFSMILFDDTFND